MAGRVKQSDVLKGKRSEEASWALSPLCIFCVNTDWTARRTPQREIPYTVFNILGASLRLRFTSPLGVCLSRVILYSHKHGTGAHNRNIRETVRAPCQVSSVPAAELAAKEFFNGSEPKECCIVSVGRAHCSGHDGCSTPLKRKECVICVFLCANPEQAVLLSGWMSG